MPAESSLFTKVLCCADFSERSLKAWGKAVGIARQNQAELSLLHVVFPRVPQLPGEPGPKQTKSLDAELAAKVKDHLREQYLALAPDMECGLFVRRGQPTVEILSHLEENPVDLVVLGSEGLSGLRLTLLGSVAERVLRHGKTTCLIVR